MAKTYLVNAVQLRGAAAFNKGKGRQRGGWGGSRVQVQEKREIGLKLLGWCLSALQ